MQEAIYVVEDDPDVREDLAYLLERRGHEVRTAANGQEALDLLRTDGASPCVLLLDLMMPVMDGWTLRGEMLKDPDLSDVPVILISSVADLQEEAQSLRAQDYLTKPVDLERLFHAVEEHCALSSQSACN